MAAPSSTLAPAMLPPPGVTANFVDPPSLLTLLNALVIFSMVMLVSILALRIWVKVRLVHRWFIDDTMCVLAVLLFIVWLGISVSGKYARLITRNEWDMYEEDLSYVLFHEYILMLVYPPCMLTAKLSVLLQIERIFAVQRDLFYYTAWTVISIITLYYSSSFFVFAFQCNPPSKAWDTSLPGKCISPYLLEAVQAGFNLVSDITTVALPIWAIFNLRVQLKKRLELLGIFSCGFLACALSICGMVFRIQLYNDPDQMRAIFIIGAFCSGETIMVILVGCMPAIAKVFFRENWRRKRSASHASPAVVVDVNGDSPPAHGHEQRPNRFLQGRTALQDSRWKAGSGVVNSLARYLGPARELLRDQRPAEPSMTERLRGSGVSRDDDNSRKTPLVSEA